MGWVLLAILLHLLISVILPHIWHWVAPAPPQRVTVETISPEKLEDLRKKLQSDPKRQLLIAPDASRPKDPSTPPPDNAKFDSDRNRRVDRETRAREAQSSIPRPAGTPQNSPPKPQTSPTQKNIPLSKLGLSRPILSPKKLPPERNWSESTSGPGGNPNPLILDEAIAEGSETLLNTRESKYYSFYARLYEAIAPIWESSAREVPRKMRLREGDYRTQVLFELYSDGKLARIYILSSSGVDPFDQAATRAIQRVAEFPNPPRDLLEQDGKIRITLGFVFRLSNQGGVSWQPIRR